MADLCATRPNNRLNSHSDALLADIASAGIDGYEPIISNPSEDSPVLAIALSKHGLEMRSLYVNSVASRTRPADESIAQAVAIAEASRELGVKIIVTNPSPIRWGGAEDKSDAATPHAVPISRSTRRRIPRTWRCAWPITTTTPNSGKADASSITCSRPPIPRT